MADGNDSNEFFSDLERVLMMTRELKPPYIELNLSCPNLENNVGSIWEPNALQTIMSKVRAILYGSGILVFVKIGHLGPQLNDILAAIHKNVDVFVLRNTLKVRPVFLDRDGRRIPAFPGRQYGGLSGPAILNVTRRDLQTLVRFKHKYQYDFDIIAVGGASTTNDVIELINEGAVAVQTATTAIFDPLFAWKVRFTINRGIKAQAKAVQERNGYDVPAGVQVMMFPRDEAERESLRNAEAALQLIRERASEQLTIPHEFFVRE